MNKIKLIIRPDRFNRLCWFAVFPKYQFSPWKIGQVKKMSTFLDALRIVYRWNIRVIDGQPFHNVFGFYPLSSSGEK